MDTTIMNTSTFMFGLLFISTISSLLTEAVKKFCDAKQWKYCANTLIGWCSILVAVLSCIGYVLYTATPVTVALVVFAIALTILSWICAMVGYDKVIQTLAQLKRG